MDTIERIARRNRLRAEEVIRDSRLPAGLGGGRGRGGRDRGRNVL